MLAKEIAGTWVRNEDMHPMTNIAGRRWCSPSSGLEGEYRGMWPTPDGMRPLDLWWHFPTAPAPRHTSR